jgi:membrane protein YqaA with SNARE-associated domain
MKNEKQALAPESSPTGPARGLNKRGRTMLFVLESLFIGSLLVIWVSSSIIQKSTNLLVLFFYSFPSEFAIALLPHEPVLIYFGKFFNPLTVTVVALSSTLVVELSNYFAIRYLIDFQMFQKIKTSALVNKVVKLFNKAPFLAIWIAGIAPIPFYPFRFLVVLAKYPAWKYILAVTLSRGPRFYLLALAGKLLKIPNIVLIVFTTFLIITADFPFIQNFLRNKIKKRQDQGEASKKE